MKKRILSFLLLVVMLVTMIPVTAVVAETAPEEEAPQTTYLDLYVKDGLVALYDAIGVDNATVDLTNMKWYPYVLAGGKLVKSEENAAIIGGSVKSESNVAGWTTADGGLGYVEHSVITAMAENRIDFYTDANKSWLNGDMEVEFLFTPHMRNDITVLPQTLSIPEGVANGDNVDYAFKRDTNWQATYADKKMGGWYFTLSVPYGVTPVDGWVEVSAATESEAGVYTFEKRAMGTAYTLSVPAGVTVISATADKRYVLSNGKETDLSNTSAFLFDNLYGYTWTAFGVWSNYPQGDGQTRWHYGDRGWYITNAQVSGMPNATLSSGIHANGGYYLDTYNIKSYNETISLMSFAKTNDNYRLTHGATVVVFELSEGKTNPTAGEGLKVLNQMPGTAYAFRVYGRALNDAEKAQNKAADIVGIYGLDVSGIDPAVFPMLGNLIATLSAAGYEGANATDLQNAIDTAAANTAATESAKTVYDALYVQDGLSALYSAYGNDASVVVSDGVVTGWINKITGESAAVVGGFVKGANGGLSIDMNIADYATLKTTMGITLSDYVDRFDDITTEAVLALRGLTVDGDGVTADTSATGVQWNNKRPSFRFGIFSYTGMVGHVGNDSTQLRLMLSNTHWNSHNGRGGEYRGYAHLGPNGDSNKYDETGNITDNYCPATYSYKSKQNVIVSMITLRDTDAEGVRYASWIGGIKQSDTTVSLEHSAIANATGRDGTGRFSLFNSAPGTAYAVRLYNRALSEDELTQNAFVDLCAYFGVELPEDFTDEVLAESFVGLMTSITSAYTFASDAETVKTAVAAALAVASLEPTVLDTLYIGADGGKTVNGGSLKALYTAYGETDASVSLDAGLWFNKVEGPDAILMGSTWKKEANGISTIFTYENKTAENRLKLDVSLLGNYNDDFTVEYAAKYPELLKNDGTVYQVNGDNTVAGNADTNGEKIVDALGFLKTKVTIVGKDKWDSAKERALRWYFSSGMNGWQTGNTYGWSNLTDYSRASRDAFVTTVVRDVTVGASETLAAYAMKTNGTVQKSATLSTVTPAYGGSYFNGTYPTANNSEEQFYLFNGQPAIVYAVRVYDSALTDAEILHNRAVDLLAFYGYEMTAELAAVIKNVDSIFSSIAAHTFTENADVFKSEVDALLDGYEGIKAEKTEYDELYVTDGLLSLYSAYEYTDDTVVGSIWADKVGGNHANLFGAFVANRDGKGGFGVSYDKNAWSSGNAASTVSGIDLPAGYADLPAFTVENIMSVENYDNWTSGNLYYKYFHTFRFDVYSASLFENAYFRTALTARSWGSHNGVPTGDVLMAHGSKYADPAHNNDLYKTGYLGGGFGFGTKQVKNMTVTKSSTADTVSFALTLNGAVQSFAGRDDMWASAEDKASGDAWANGTTGVRVNTTIETRATISKDAYNTVKNGASTQSTAFSVMYGMQGTMYAVRVYNRVLKTEEKNQNHAVDLFAYTGVSLETYPEDETARAWIAEQLADVTFANATADAILALFATEFVTVTFKDEQGATLDSYLVAAGATVALPLYANGLNAIWWNEYLAGTSVAVTEDTVFVADTIIAPISDGVSMRVASTAEDTGLRFYADFAKADWATIAKGAERIHLGMLITPKAFVESAGAFTKEALDAYAQGNNAYVDITLPGYYEMKDEDTYTLAASLIGLTDTTIEKDITFAAIAYLEIDFDGDGAYDRVIYGTCDLDACKSVKTIADGIKAAIDDETTDLTEDQQAWFNTFYGQKWPAIEA